MPVPLVLCTLLFIMASTSSSCRVGRPPLHQHTSCRFSRLGRAVPPVRASSLARLERARSGLELYEAERGNRSTNTLVYHVFAQEPTAVRGGKTRGENRAPSMLALVVFRAFLPSSSPLQQRHDQSTGTSGPRPVSRVLHVVFSLFYRTRGAPLPTTRATRISTIAPLGSTL